MPTLVPPSPSRELFAYLHFENATSCKAWRMVLKDMAGSGPGVGAGPGLWTIKLEFGPATRTAPGGTPAIKSSFSQKRTFLDGGVPFGMAAGEFIRRVNDQIKDGYKILQKDLTPEIESVLGIATGLGPRRTAAGSKNELMEKLSDLLDPSLPDKMPVLLDGPPGTGKTYTCREFAKTAGFHAAAEVAGNASMESIDFLGGMVPLGGGKMIWMDGPVTRAFREAAKGRKMLLIIDELLRIPRRERGIFLNALIPHDGHYRLRTGRPVGVDESAGIASMELIGAPVSNLSIVATTNSGSNYPDVENEDPASRERWHIIHVKQQETLLTSIIQERVVKRGWPIATAERFVAVQKAIKKVFDDNFCEKELSPRLTLRVVDLTKEPTTAGIHTAARELIPALTSRTPDGDIIKEQEESLETAIKTALKL